MLRRLRRRARIVSLIPLGFWLYKERHVIGGMVGFARTVPDRMRMGRGSEVGLAAKVNLALLREPELRGADLRIGAVQDGDVCIEAGPGSEAAAETARRLVERLPGVTSVRIEGTQAHPAPSTVAGEGTASTPAAPTDVPVRV